jgi:hypothetical protein
VPVPSQQPLMRVEVNGKLADLEYLPQVKAAMVPGKRYLSEHEWADFTTEKRIYERWANGSLVYHVVTEDDLRPAPTAEELAWVRERRARWLASSAECPRGCPRRYPLDRIEEHAREHCPVEDCRVGILYTTRWSGRFVPASRRHILRHLLRVFLDARGVVVPDTKFDALVDMEERSRAGFIKALAKILRREGVVVAIAKVEAPCVVCGDLIHPGDLTVLVPGRGWAHLLCSDRRPSALANKEKDRLPEQREDTHAPGER